MINKKSLKQISIAFTIFMFSLCINNTNAQGPNAPEAASFEPVDATDMVNLLTGDMSYSLPLLNIPSPEGGYPIALSYHAGIPLDLEASWVGLGWNLNPGAINRNVNGYPDDWGESTVNHFFNDAGWTDTYYDFGIGANIYGINVGVGAYWGSNKTFGGSVALGIGNIAGTVEAGTRGFGVGGQIIGAGGSISANVSTNGIGVSANTAVGGLGLNYNYNSGLSGAISINTGIGISLNSQGGVSGSIGNYGGGINNSRSSASAGDYAVTIKTKGINLDLFLFNIKASRTQVKYDLYKEDFDKVTGILHPYDLPVYNEGTSMDVVTSIAYDESISPITLINSKDQLQYNHLLYPGFDNYSLAAQGISGSIQPKFIEEANLYSKYKTDGEDDYKSFVFDSNQQDLNLELNNRLFFYFKAQYNSFLRTNINSIVTPGSTIENMYNNSYTNKSAMYSSNTTPNGELLAKNNRMRTGNFIETFTNEEINLINSQNITADYFIEAKGIDRLNDEAFVLDGVGAFKVTTTDGKTYYYSLPVYNFELYYKNFNNSTDEDEKFYLNTKDTPYATHWLLTAITGPDYIDNNMDGKLDKDDYGYWVEFEYGKWTDGYIWKGASGDYDVVKGAGTNDDTYEYYRGRKQIYYLDAIKTRTHTAYFVKSLREDNKGEQWLYSKNNIKVPSSGSYDIFNYTKEFSSNNTNEITKPQEYNLPEDYDSPWGLWIYSLHFGSKSNYKYADFPKHDVLKLDKIILVNNTKKNNNNISIDKFIGTPLNNRSDAFFYKNSRFKIDRSIVSNNGNGGYWVDCCYSKDVVGYWHDDFELQNIGIHQSQNVLDVNDLVGLNIEQYAEKVINFNYDVSYPLVKNSPRSDATSKGKLTLNSISYGGKEGIQLTPPYKFTYKFPNTNFDIAKEDAWGFHKDYPESWSLNEIKTPIGTKIKIDYESDDFYREAIDSKRIFNNGLSFLITKNTSDELLFEITLNDHVDAKTIDDFNNFTDYFQLNEYANLDLFICRRSQYGGSRRAVELDIDKLKAEIISVNSQSVTIKILNDSGFWTFDDQNDGWILNRIFSLTDVTHSNGSGDSVIMRQPGLDNCTPWRTTGYSNDDVSMNFQITTSTVPYNKTEGGVRVKTIEINDNNQSFKTNYYYNEKGYDKSQDETNYRSSGITSYSPSKEAKAIPYISELPSPMVMYKYVTVENINDNNTPTASSLYEFETLTPYQSDNNYIYSLGEAFKVKKEFETSQFSGDLIANKHTIYNKLSNIGRLVSLKEFNSEGQIIEKQYNTYKQSTDLHGEIGVFEESYLSKSRNSIINPGSGDPIKYFINATSRVNYPSVLESTTTTQSGFTSTTNFTTHDFLTGQVLETITKDSKGNEFRTELVPAYTIDEYSGLEDLDNDGNPDGYGMGSKVDIESNKNMLTQEAMTKTYVKIGEDWKQMGVGITTWNNQWKYWDYKGDEESAQDAGPNVWRKHKTFVWDGDLNTDGTFSGFSGEDDNFVWTVGANIQQTNTVWKNTSTTTRYDHFSMPLEVRDINNNYMSTKTCDDQSKILAVGNSAYTEMFYSGAEHRNNNSFYFDGEVGALGEDKNGDIGIGIGISQVKAHTGEYSVRLSNQLNSFEVKMKANEHRTSKYKLSVWIDKGNEDNVNVVVNDVLKPFNGERVYAGNWVLLMHYETLSKDTAYTIGISKTSGIVYADDFRLHPIASSMTSYVYNQWDELWYIIGNNGLASKFEYDSQGRLIKTYTEVADFNGEGSGGFKPVSENNYNYKKPQ